MSVYVAEAQRGGSCLEGEEDWGLCGGRGITQASQKFGVFGEQ